MPEYDGYELPVPPNDSHFRTRATPSPESVTISPVRSEAGRATRLATGVSGRARFFVGIAFLTVVAMVCYNWWLKPGKTGQQASASGVSYTATAQRASKAAPAAQAEKRHTPSAALPPNQQNPSSPRHTQAGKQRPEQEQPRRPVPERPSVSGQAGTPKVASSLSAAIPENAHKSFGSHGHTSQEDPKAHWESPRPSTNDKPSEGAKASPSPSGAFVATATVQPPEGEAASREKRANALWHEAQRLAKQEKWAEAARTLEKAIPETPKGTAYRSALGSCLYGDGQYGRTVDQLKTVVQNDPKNALAWHVLGHSYSRTGFDLKALLAFQKAIKAEPSRACHYACAARLITEAYQRDPEFWKHLPLARHWYNKALELGAKPHELADVRKVLDNNASRPPKSAGGVNPKSPPGSAPFSYPYTEVVRTPTQTIRSLPVPQPVRGPHTVTAMAWGAYGYHAHPTFSVSPGSHPLSRPSFSPPPPKKTVSKENPLGSRSTPANFHQVKAHQKRDPVGLDAGPHLARTGFAVAYSTPNRFLGGTRPHP